MNRTTATILTTVLLAATAQLACAADPVDDSRRQIVVHFADLNLDSAHGAASLYNRLNGAAKDVCREEGTRDVASIARVKTCVAAAVSVAVARVDRPALTAYYRAKLAGTNGALLQASR
jgi:UrcA family protein